MDLEPTPIPDLKIVKPRVFEDDRGFFYESYNEEKFRAHGLPTHWAQDNHAYSVKNTLRGLHFQRPSAGSPGQAKLVRVTHGAVWDVAADIRPASPTFKKWFGVELTGENHKMFFIPEGFAHGYIVLSETAEFLYKCSTVYNAELESEIAWNDPELAIGWPVSSPLLSKRDKNAQSLRDYVNSIVKDTPPTP